MSINQAVVFTKPLHHLGIELSSEQLDEYARSFLEEKNFRRLSHQRFSGSDLLKRNVIRQHYRMYSEGSYGSAAVSEEGKAGFFEVFGKSWDDEVEAGRISGNPQLMERKGIDVHELFNLFSARLAAGEVPKIQSGMFVAWIEELGSYCINGFYPVMESNFCHPDTRMDYYVVEFDPAETSWREFRRNILGVTDASRAVPESFRGRLYSQYPVEFPGRDNFVHGSAGPLEGFVERAIHEPDFAAATNPVGQYLEGRGVTLDRFKRWKSSRMLHELGALFDATEEKDTAEVLRFLDGVDFA